MAVPELEVIPPELSKSQQRRQGHKLYSPEKKAECLALAKEGIKPPQISRQTGVNVATVYGWIYASDESETLEKSLDLAQRFERAAGLFLSIAVKKARKASFRDLMTAAGIAVDKSQLLSGLPTSITGSVMSEDERKLKIAELLAKLKARQTETPE